MKHGPELLESLKLSLEHQRESMRRREERISNCEVDPSDCFLSIAADSVNVQLDLMKIKILEDGGLSEFGTLLFLNGEEVPGRWADTRYGFRFVTKDGEFVDPFIKPKNLEKKGYKYEPVLKPAWCKISGNRISWHVTVFQSNFNYWTGEGTF